MIAGISVHSRIRIQTLRIRFAQVKEEPGCIEALHTLETSENPDVRKAAKGALWKLRAEDDFKRERSHIGSINNSTKIQINCKGLCCVKK